MVSGGIPAQAQTTPVWPEIDTYHRLNDTIRLNFLATTVQENRESTEAEFGVNVFLSGSAAADGVRIARVPPSP